MFIAIVKLIAFKVFFIIKAFFDQNINQINVKIAFLYNFIDQLIYVKIFSKKIKSAVNYDIIYKILKVLYSFK